MLFRSISRHDSAISLGPMPDLGPIQPEVFVDLFTGAEKVIEEIAVHVIDRRKPSGN